VVAYLALFVALGGTSVAAVSLSRNSVKSQHIKNGQVKRADLGKNAVNSSKVADGSLLAGDFAAGQLQPGPEGERGAEGPRGPAGADGDDGAPGAPGPQAVKLHGRPPFVIEGPPYTVAITSEWSLTVRCFGEGLGGDTTVQLKSNSTGSPHRLSASWVDPAGANQRLVSTASGDVEILTGNGNAFSPSESRWDGQIIHSSPSGVATVNFHVFLGGGCGIDGVGVVSH
jgi:hypothetical protein